METIEIASGRQAREAPRLQFGGAHLADPGRDWPGDVLARIGSGLLLGLLGTVVGTIKIFSVIMLEGGTGNPGALAGGISEALIATATGLVVAIPASLISRYYYRLVDGFMISIQQDAMKLVDALHSDRKVKGSD